MTFFFKSLLTKANVKRKLRKMKMPLTKDLKKNVLLSVIECMTQYVDQIIKHIQILALSKLSLARTRKSNNFTLVNVSVQTTAPLKTTQFVLMETLINHHARHSRLPVQKILTQDWD